MACFLAVQVKMFVASHSDVPQVLQRPTESGAASPTPASNLIPPTISETLSLAGWLAVGSVELTCTRIGAQDFLCKILLSFSPSFEKY